MKLCEVNVEGVMNMYRVKWENELWGLRTHRLERNYFGMIPVILLRKGGSILVPRIILFHLVHPLSAH